MKTIQPNAKLIKHDVHPYEIIERIGRICYKSEDRITKDSCLKFVSMLANKGHTAMLEHEHLYFLCSPEESTEFKQVVGQHRLKYFNVSNTVISGSFRAMFELCMDYLPEHISLIDSMYKQLHSNYSLVFSRHNFDIPEDDDISTQTYSSGPMLMSRDDFIEYASMQFESDRLFRRHLVHTVVFTCDRGVSHELVRHRNCAFAQESTRYCNYSNNKFDNEVTVVKPSSIDENTKEYTIWHNACMQSEASYFSMLALGATPQQARSVLPNSLKTEIAVTATEEEWIHIFGLRYYGITGAPHPDMQSVMAIARTELMSATDGRIY